MAPEIEHEEAMKVPSKRIEAPIELEDLRRLALVARKDREHLLGRLPAVDQAYRRRVLCVALCQGAGSHYARQRGYRIDEGMSPLGVRDFDVWTFFKRVPGVRLWRRRRVTRPYSDFLSKGKRATNPFASVDVDLFVRAIPWQDGQSIQEALREYLRSGKTKTARKLAEKAIVVLEPGLPPGRVIWPRYLG